MNASGSATAVTGAAVLLRATVKHDSRCIAPWVLIITVLTATSVLAYPIVFPTLEDRASLALAIGANPAIGLIFGPAVDLSTAEGFVVWRTLALGGFLAALGAVFALTRATRAQEDSGQAELLASSVLGRASRLLVGIVMGLIASLLVGVVPGVAAAFCGGEWESSMLLGATFTATGLMFTGVAAVAAQLGSDARTANSISIGTFGGLFLLRGFAYSVNAPVWTIWANPLGWLTQTRPAAGNHWWPLWFTLAFAVLALAIAFSLQARRDFAEGVFAPRTGTARGTIRSPWGLTLRLNRGHLMTWAIVFLGLGVVFGYFATSINDMLASDSAVKQILAARAVTNDQLVSAFLVTILSLVGIMAAIPGVHIMLKVRSEEMNDRVDPILASKVRRIHYYGGNAVLALLASSCFVMVAGLLIAILTSTAGLGVSFGEVILQALVTVPAVWAVVAVAVAVVGAKPRLAIASWAGILISFSLTLLGPTLKLGDSTMAMSPFFHVPNLATADSQGWGLLMVVLVTALLVVIGCVGFRRRDLAL
ncbi:ABC transporter permease [Arthrobacter psychrolactophilus]